MLVVFGTAKLLAEIFERLHMPGIVGEIAAGMLIGPAVLGWVQPNQILDALSDIGVMFLLFRVGLELRSSELMRVGGTAALVAIAGVIVPFVAGWGLLTLRGFNSKESLFVGAAMVATSVGITAHVLASKGLLHLMSSKIILAAAVIDDVLGLIVLAVVSSFAAGELHLGDIALTTALAVGFTLIIARWGTRAMGHVVPRVEQSLAAGEVQFNLALVFLFAMAVLAAYAGIAAIIGAFLAGMALAETVSHRVHELATGISEFLVPFFLAGIGLKFSFDVFHDSRLIGLTALIVIAAVLSKLIGCGIGAYRLPRADMLRIGVGMVPRGEVGMVVAQIGMSAGIIEKRVYSVVVLMAILTTVLAPPLLSIAYRNAEKETPEEKYTLG